MTNRCNTLLLAHELYSCIPTIPKMMMIAVKMISRMKMIKKKILGKVAVNLVTIIARRLMSMMAMATICPIFWKVNSHALELI